jgi:hypothetical protein
MGRLASKHGDVSRQLAVSQRSKKADKAALAGQFAVLAENLDTDIIHWNAAMHRRTQSRFCNYQRGRPIEEFEGHRTKIGTLGARTKHPPARIGEHAEPAGSDRIQPGFAIPREAVIAATEKGEVVILQPIEKGDVLVEFRCWNSGWIAQESGPTFAESAEHWFPVPYRSMNIGKNLS